MRLTTVLILAAGLLMLGCNIGAGDDCESDADCGACESCSGGSCVASSGQRAQLCDGTAVAYLDLCSGTLSEKEACSAACYQGECVTCAPDAGAVCDGDSIRSVDSCGVQGAVIETCADGCANGACGGSSCSATTDATCVGDDLYALDSCGFVDSYVRTCPNGCDGGTCLSCTADSFITCYDGDIYTLDSCMHVGGLHQDCAADVCEATPTTVACVSGVTCTPAASQVCFAGDLHLMDSCGNVQTDLASECPNGCDTTGCLPCEPYPTGTTCVGSDLHELIAGCASIPAEAGTLLETCAHGCQNGACLPDGCIADVGTICVGTALHAVDSCGTPGDLLETCTAGCQNGACTVDTTGPFYVCVANDGMMLLEVNDAACTASDCNSSGSTCGCSFVGDCNCIMWPGEGSCFDDALCAAQCGDT